MKKRKENYDFQKIRIQLDINQSQNQKQLKVNQSRKFINDPKKNE